MTPQPIYSRPVVFISYASEQRAEAEKIYFALLEDGINVFMDKMGLLAGDGFYGPLEKAAKSADIFIFLISRESLRSTRFTLTELGWAQDKWPHPQRHVLPIVIGNVDGEKMSNYLTAVTYKEKGDLRYEAHGNLAAAVRGWVGKLIDEQRRFVTFSSLLIGLASGIATFCLQLMTGPTGQSTPEFVYFPLYSLQEFEWQWIHWTPEKHKEGVAGYIALPFSIAMATIVWRLNGRLWDAGVAFLGTALAAWLAITVALGLEPQYKMFTGIAPSSEWNVFAAAQIASIIPGLIGAVLTWLAVALSCDRAQNPMALMAVIAAGLVGWGYFPAAFFSIHEIGIVGNLAADIFVVAWQTLVAYAIGYWIAVPRVRRESSRS